MPKAARFQNNYVLIHFFYLQPPLILSEKQIKDQVVTSWLGKSMFQQLYSLDVPASSKSKRYPNIKKSTSFVYQLLSKLHYSIPESLIQIQNLYNFDNFIHNLKLKRSQPFQEQVGDYPVGYEIWQNCHNCSHLLPVNSSV